MAWMSDCIPHKHYVITTPCRNLILLIEAEHTRVNYLIIIDSDNGLSSGRRQVIISTNAGILLNRLLGTYFSEILMNFYIVMKQNALENVIKIMATVLS